MLNILSAKKPLFNLFNKTLVCVYLFVAVFSAQAAETTIYYHTDLLGSPVASSNETGSVVWKETYKPYGERVINDPEAADNILWYTGKPHDSSTGLSYYGARYYDPVIGRFMAIDPVGFQEGNPTSFNRYAYANNNPYKYVDPDGNLPILLLAFAASDFYNAYQETGSIGQAAGAAVLGAINPFGKAAKAVKAAKGVPKPTRHSVNQKINRQVKSSDELDAIKNPLDKGHIKTDSLGRRSQRSVGERAEVAVNPDTNKIVSVNPTSTKKAERLKRRNSN